MQGGPPRANTLAIAGFLAPFVAAGITGALVLMFQGDATSIGASLLYLFTVPLFLVTGLILSLRSIPFIEKLGDKDYAYSGLTLNILFLILYIISVIYFVFQPR